MIEVPSAALMADLFAPEVDFFSIGTNDLTQYTLAMDRDHPRLASQADSFHTAVLRLIAATVKAAHAHGKWVGVCGALASEALAAPVLIGLGVDELSVSVPLIPTIKATVRELDLAGLPAIRFVFPHAKTMPVTINGGYVMRSWYDILGTELTRREDEGGLRSSQLAVEALIEREKSRGIPASRIILAGFSQGCAMALLTGLRHGERLAAIVGLSGYLPLAATTEAERSDANRDTPIFLAHGSRDGVVVPARAATTRKLLDGLGHAVEWHEYPMEHSVSMEEIADLEAFLQRVLARS